MVLDAHDFLAIEIDHGDDPLDRPGIPLSIGADRTQ